MIRGTTPELTFKLPFSADTLSEIYISFAQNRTVIFEKTKSECTIDGNLIKVHLNQQDTLNLKNELTVEVQIRAITNGGDRIASHIIQASAKRILKDGEI